MNDVLVDAKKCGAVLTVEHACGFWEINGGVIFTKETLEAFDTLRRQQDAATIEQLQARVAQLEEAIADAIAYIETSEPYNAEEVLTSALSSSSLDYLAQVKREAVEQFIDHLRTLPVIGLSERQFGELKRANPEKKGDKI